MTSVRRTLARYDWLLMGALGVLFLASMLSISSISSSLAITQATWLSLALLIIFVASRIDFRAMANYRWIMISLYLGAFALLLSTLLFAPVINESQSWLSFGAFRFQPSELMKVALILFASVFLARRHVSIGHVRNLFVSFVYFLLPAGVILMQPDWGSALVVLFLWAGFLLVSGIRWRHLAIGTVLVAVLGVLSWHFFLAPYQKERILGFLDPTYDPLGVNYSVIQAQIAIGSAGFLGKGFGQGTQTQLGFLTEPTNDFIFAAFTEEWGLLGGGLVLSAFLFLIFRIVSVGLRTTDSFSQFVCLGTAILFLTEFTFNIGSNLSLLPVVGVTFPFLSYGGSSLLTKAMLVGIIQGISVRSS